MCLFMVCTYECVLWQSIVCIDGQVTLYNGNFSAGPVTVCMNNSYIRVCYASWDILDAGIVCKQLGYNFSSKFIILYADIEIGFDCIFISYMYIADAEAYKENLVQQSVSSSVLIASNCIGNESDLLECSHILNSSSDCPSNASAGAKCGGMYVCMYAYACMYACMYVCMYVCMHVCMYVCMHACMYVCMYVYMYVCMHACMYVCMYVVHYTYCCCCCIIIVAILYKLFLYIGLCEEGKVRQFYHTLSKSMVVEICRSGYYTTLCGQSWSDKEASVVCAQLGFSSIGICMLHSICLLILYLFMEFRVNWS